MTDFIYWPHPTPVGINVEEISGCESKSGKAWRELARQIYCENGKENYREIFYSDLGAPLLEGSDQRISISHAGNLFVVASLPPTPECDLERFSRRAALGVDCERGDRQQVLPLRPRFLSAEEMEMIPSDNVGDNILAWTIKEAVYKAMLTQGLDFRKAIRIISLPGLAEFDPFAKQESGKAAVTLSDGEKEETIDFDIYSYLSDGYIVTLAYSPKCAKFMPPRPAAGN